MDYLTQLLQSNPLIILAMFLISVISSTMTIIFGWKRFYNDFLSKSVTLPVWLILSIIFVIFLVVIFKPALADRTARLKTIKGVSFGVQRVLLDGKRFVNCTFDRSELFYRGEAGCELKNNTLKDVHITFGGPAGRTLSSLANMYRVPSLRPLIDNTFSRIKEDKMRKVPQPARDAGD